MKKASCLVGAAIAVTGFCLLPVAGSVTARAYTKTEEYYTRLQLSPSVIARVADRESYEAALTAENKPTSVILGAGLNGLTAENDESVGTVKEVFEALGKSGILPVCTVESELQAQTLSAAVASEGYFDFAFMGSDASVLKKAKALVPDARVYMDFSQEEPYADAYDYIKESREAGGNVVILSEKQADRETVYYLQSMLTTVWVKPSQETKFGFASAVTTGAYGIIAADYATLYAVYDEYPVYSLPRGYYVIGHRGFPYGNNENSIEGCLAACEAGATHVEIDVHVTADGKLVIMHDATIDRTTNGTGVISQMTLEEIKRYKIVKDYAGELTGTESEIPTLAELFEALKEKDVVVIVEIKVSHPQIAQLVKDEIIRCGMEKRTLSISFLDTVGGPLEKLHEIMPTLPIASLNGTTEDTFDAKLKQAAQWNMAFDPGYDINYKNFLNSNFKDRGYMAWTWTHNDPSPVALGITGITQNHVDLLSKYTKRLEATSGLSLAVGETPDGKTFEATKILFDGTEEKVQASVFMSEKVKGGYNVILTAEDLDETYYSKLNLYSQPVFIAQEEAKAEEPEPTKEGGCKSSGAHGAIAIGSVCCGAAVAATVIGKKRGTRKN